MWHEQRIGRALRSLDKNPSIILDISGMFRRSAERQKTLEIREILMEGHRERVVSQFEIQRG